MSPKPNQEPELQWIEDGILFLMGATLALIVVVIKIFATLICAVWSVFTRTDDTQR